MPINRPPAYDCLPAAIPFDWRPLGVFLASCVALVVLLVNPGGASDGRFLGFLLLLLTTGTIVYLAIPREGGLLLDPWTPSSFYAVFFGVYYLIPYSILLFDSRTEARHLVAMGTAILLGVVAFVFGVRMAKGGHQPRLPALDNAGAFSLLCVCWVSMALIAYLNYWRIENGHFYTHAAEYVVGTDTQSSLLESFVWYLQFPVIFLAGLVVAVSERFRPAASLTIKLYVLASFLTYIASSQFRPAATILPLGWIALKAFRLRTIAWGPLLRIGMVAIASLAVIFIVRASGANDELAGSGNQLVDLARGVMQGNFFDTSTASEAIFGSTETASETRAVSPLIFFDDVYESIGRDGMSHGFGKSFSLELHEFIPRVFWPDKPTFESTQIMIRQELNMSATDNSPSPILQFYYELGWPGIIAGFFCLGFGIQWLANRTAVLAVFIAFSFAWSCLIQVETGVFLGLLVSLRAAVIVYVFWRILSLLLRGRVQSGAIHHFGHRRPL